MSIVRKFTQELKYTRGSIYEFDNITQLIYDLLENHKTKEEEGDIKEEIDSTQIQNVLIIDDIDRIDPEHIFRILNIFSAHFDIENEDNNKFGFDKIIFVCDINNVRNIFCTKYGLNTDFNGYINKFFNSHIYEFDNYDEIEKGFNDYIIDLTNKNNVNSIYSSFSPTLRKIINHLIYSNEINIRHLQNLEKINWHKTEIKVSNEILNNFPFYNLLRVLLFVFNNDKEKLINAFQRLRFNNEFDMRYDNLIAVLLPLIQSKKYANPSYIERGKPYVYDNEKLDLKIIYRINNYSNNYYIAEVLGVGFYNDKYKILSDKHEENIKVVWNNDMSVGSIIKEFTEKDNYYLLIEAIKSLEESNLLKNWVTRH